MLERSSEDGEVTVELRLEEQAIVTRVGPFAPDAMRAELERDDDSVGLRRILDTVVDGYELDDDGLARADEERHRRGRRRLMQQSDKVLLRRYHEQGDLAAREQLIEQYMSLVRSLARRYSYRGEQLEDLVQIGAIGLIKAIDRFDVNRGVELTTYATPNIIGEIKRHFRDRGWSVRVPRGLQELNIQLSRLIEQLTVQHGRSPTIPELAKAASVTDEEVLEALESGRAYTLALALGRLRRARRGRRARPARVARHRGAPVRGLRGPRRARARASACSTSASARSCTCASSRA